jgi:outer membrane protein assembly factor BamB
VADYGDKILILDVKNPGNLIVKDKEMGKGELFKLVNMDENGIVGSYYSEGAPSSMDDQKLGGKKPGVFSSLVYLDYKGQFKWDPVEFGMHIYPAKMPMLNGRVYLDIGQREMYYGDVTSLYCFDLKNKTDLWKRSHGRGVVPTEDLVYSNGGAIAVNEYGETVWDTESLGRSIRLLHLSITRDHVVRHIEDSEARDKGCFIEVIDRYNGTEIAKWEIQNPSRGEIHSQLMMCVDSS